MAISRRRRDKRKSSDGDHHVRLPSEVVVTSFDGYAPPRRAPVPDRADQPPSPVTAPVSGVDPSPWNPVVVDTPIVAFEPRPADARAYRADTIIDAFATPSFVVRAASTRGYSHRAGRTPRQDDFAVAWHEGSGAVVVAVADGVSAAPLSHVGATLAVRQVIAGVLDALDADDEIDWHAVVSRAAWALVEHAQQRLGVDVTTEDAAAEAERIVATALIVAVVRADGADTSVATAVVGDCIAMTLGRGTFRHLIGGKATTGLTITSGVDCLPRIPSIVKPSVFHCGHDEVVLIGTDGFGDALGDGDGHVGELFAGALASPPPPLRFAHVVDFSRETFDDDRTVVALWRRG
jgi:hypothetical protein